MVPADRFPTVSRSAATLPVRFPVVCRLVAVSGCQSFCCGFRLLDSAARFPAVNCLAAVSAPDFWLPIAFAATLPVRFPVVCRLVAVSGGQSFCCGFRLLDSAARFPAVNCLAAVSAPDFWLPIAFVATFARPIPVAWLPGPAVSLLPGSSDPCGSGALAAAACGSRFSGRRAPEFRP